jgi:hypothetical protein
MHKLLILFLILVALFFMLMKKPRESLMDYASGTGPGYIPAFQGHPQIGVRT